MERRDAYMALFGDDDGAGTQAHVDKLKEEGVAPLDADITTLPDEIVDRVNDFVDDSAAFLVSVGLSSRKALLEQLARKKSFTPIVQPAVADEPVPVGTELEEDGDVPMDEGVGTLGPRPRRKEHGDGGGGTGKPQRERRRERDGGVQEPEDRPPGQAPPPVAGGAWFPTLPGLGDTRWTDDLLPALENVFKDVESADPATRADGTRRLEVLTDRVWDDKNVLTMALVKRTMDYVSARKRRRHLDAPDWFRDRFGKLP
jgi:hypothetical protein